MKIVMFFSLVLLASCGNKAEISKTKQAMADSAIVLHLSNVNAETTQMRLERKADSLQAILVNTAIDLINQNDSLRSALDSLKVRYWVARYAYKRIRKRIQIVIANPTQLKFLNGWDNRIGKSIGIEPWYKK